MLNLVYFLFVVLSILFSFTFLSLVVHLYCEAILIILFYFDFGIHVICRDAENILSMQDILAINKKTISVRIINNL